MRSVEWVCHLADQATDSVARQPRVGVERDHIADVGGDGWRLPADAHERRVGRSTQQSVEFVQLAALALPPDPSRLAGIPESLAMQQQETVTARCRAIAPIKPGDAGCRRLKQRFIAISMRCRGIEPVREESEMQLALRTRKMVDLQTLDLFLNRLGRRQQRGHGDECS
jgi:hypothetical protein